MATIRSLRRRWRAKQYISAAMLGTLFVIALVATTSISLAPAHISFYIQDTNITTYPERHSNTHLNFTLVANNTSQRTAVRFTSMIAEIWYGPAATAWIRTHVHEKAGLPAGWQPPRSMVRINVSADYGYDRMSNVTNDCSVVVESKVWFRFGLASTRPFTVRFSCLNVNFSDHNIFPVLCG